MIIRKLDEVIGDRPLHTVPPGMTLRDACAVLKAADVGALAVMTGQKLVGILSERDVIRRGVCEHRPMDTTLVEEVMTADPVTVASTASLAEAMEVMMTGKFRHLPVTRGPSIVGMLSMRDIPTEYRLMFERFVEAKLGPQADERGIRRH